MNTVGEAFYKWCDKMGTEPIRQFQIVFEVGYNSATNFQFRLGQFVEDKYTKFQGMVRARTEYVTGC